MHVEASAVRSGPHWQNVPLAITVASVAAVSLFTWAGWTLCSLLTQAVLISVVIWQACDPFAEASQWIGKMLQIPGSVRGATLDAVASSLPEMLLGVFFVVLALLSGEDPSDQARLAGEGYASSLATCTGSAIYNMILIPAFCVLVISFTRRQRPTIDIDARVITRDGVWYLGAQVLMVALLISNVIYWWAGVVLLGMYGVYIAQLYFDALAHRRAYAAIHAHLRGDAADASSEEIVAALRASGLKASPALVDDLRHERDRDPEDPSLNDSEASLLFGTIRVRLSYLSAWSIIAGATVVAAVACYWLVEVTTDTASELQAPVFFVAVILTAAASSVPDTFLSIGAARRGDDDGAVSNALGSNTFNICVALSLPLLVCCALNDWQPVYLTHNGQPGGKPMSGLLQLYLLLCGLTVVTMLILWHNRQLTRTKGLILCVMYGIFIGYAVAGSVGLLD